MRKRGNAIRKTRVDTTRWIRAFGVQAPLSNEHAGNIAIFYHQALESLRRGQATDSDMNELARATNMAMVLCEFGLGLEHLEYAKAAQEALVRADAYRRQCGHWRLDGNGYRAVCEAFEVHDQQLALATQAQIRAAHETVLARCREGDFVRIAESQH